MATTTTILVLGALSVVGVTVSIALPQSTDLPIKELIGAGAAGCLLVAMYMNNKHVEKVTDTFGDTTSKLFDANREDNKVARQELQELLRDIRRTPQ